MYKLDRYWHGLLPILFPQRCAGCDTVLIHQEHILCSTCLYHLPQTDHHKDTENETAKQLWGKVKFQYAASMLTLSKSSRVQRIIHQLKYGQQPEIGIYLGKMYGQILLENPIVDRVDIIVPIPIHSIKKEKTWLQSIRKFCNGPQ